MTDRQIRAAIDGLLKQRKSPLEGCGAYFWVLGRFHGIDGRLAVGIAAAETSFATDPNMPQADLQGHNAWGYGHPPSATHGHLFACWEDGIAAVTQWLAQEYVAKGFNTVAKIEPKWVGRHPVAELDQERDDDPGGARRRSEQAGLPEPGEVPVSLRPVGTFRVRLDVGDAGRERFEPVDALVGTGAS